MIKSVSLIFLNSMNTTLKTIAENHKKMIFRNCKFLSDGKKLFYSLVVGFFFKIKAQINGTNKPIGTKTSE